MNNDLDTLVSGMAVRRVGEDLFEGNSARKNRKRIFGGQVLAQTVEAASATVSADRPIHSIHAYFLRLGLGSEPVSYRVDRVRDGRSFSARTVTASQEGKELFIASASFHADERSIAHQDSMPAVPSPDELVSDEALQTGMAKRYPGKVPAPSWNPFEVKPLEPRDYLHPEPAAAQAGYWMRAPAPLANDPVLHRSLLAYMSDMYLLGAAVRPHGLSFWSSEFRFASLDHSLWFHDDFRVDDWLLYWIDSPKAVGGRGFNRGAFYTRDGKLVASAAQEALIRVAGSS